MQTYTRKQLMDITGLPDKTLRWLLSRLEIDPVNTTKTAFGRPVYHYDYSTLHKLHEYIFQQTKRAVQLVPPHNTISYKGGAAMPCNCICSNEYRDCNGIWNYKASVSVSGTFMNVGINVKMCELNRCGLFKVNIPIVSSTASNLVFLVTCCGATAPLYSGVTGLQLTATSLTAEVTYVITYDKFTKKFFVTGV